MPPEENKQNNIEEIKPEEVVENLESEVTPKEETSQTEASEPVEEIREEKREEIEEPEEEEARSSNNSDRDRMRELWGRFMDKVANRKKAKLEKIMVLVVKKGKIVNDDVEKLLHVSDATASRYLRELVLSGRLQRSGAGRGAFYEPI